MFNYRTLQLNPLLICCFILSTPTRYAKCKYRTFGRGFYVYRRPVVVMRVIDGVIMFNGANYLWADLIVDK